MLNYLLFLAVFVYVHFLVKKGFSLQWTKEEESAKALFNAQVDRYYRSLRFMAVWHGIEIALGKGLDTWTSD